MAQNRTKIFYLIFLLVPAFIAPQENPLLILAKPMPKQKETVINLARTMAASPEVNVVKNNLKSLLDKDDFCTIARGDLFEEYRLSELVEILLESSTGPLANEDSQILLRALAAVDKDESIHLLEQSETTEAKFFKALFHAELFNSGQDPDYEQALEILEELKQTDSKNAAISYYLAMVKKAAQYPDHEIRRELKGATRGEYFNKYITQTFNNIWSEVRSLPSSYLLLAINIHARLNYPQTISTNLRKVFRSLSTGDQDQFAKILVSKALERKGKGADLHWDFMDYLMGYRILQVNRKTDVSTPLPTPYIDVHSDFSWFQELEGFEYEALRRDLYDPSSPCPTQGMQAMKAALEKLF